MRSLFETGVEAEVLRRLEKLTAGTAPHWGVMKAPAMLAHCRFAVEVALGQQPQDPSPWFIRLLGSFFKGQATSDKPFPRNSPTAPSFRMTGIYDFETEKTRFKAVLGAFSKGGPGAVKQKTHGFYGPLTEAQWGITHFKHIDHHFQQFGI